MTVVNAVEYSKYGSTGFELISLIIRPGRHGMSGLMNTLDNVNYKGLNAL